MKALFGVVSLLVVLAIVGLIAVKQLKAVARVGVASVPGAEASAAPQITGSGNVRQQAQQVQSKVVDDVAKAMKQGSEARRDESEKP